MSGFEGTDNGGIELTDEFAPQRLLFASMIIVMSGAVFFHYFRDTILPYTVVVFLFGILLGLFSKVPGFVEFQSVFKNFAELPPRMLFHIFLPVLIFEGAYGIRTHVLTKVLPISALLATAGLILNTLLVAGCLKAVVDDVNWYAACLLGSVLSATDPVAVVCLLKSLGVDAGITALIDSEAIMNDGTAIITYVLLFPAAVAGSWETTSTELLANVFQLMIGAIFLGLAFGHLMHKILRACEGDDIMFAIVAVTFTFIVYFTADVTCDTSGVLTLFVTGTYLARNYPSRFPGKMHSVMMNSFEFFVQTLNTMLFCMVGIIVSRQAIASISLWTVFLQLYMHIACSLCRFLMLFLLWPILNLNPSYKLRWQHVVLTAHGGLKGGVATILTLVIVTSGALSKEITELFLHVNLGVVMLSLMTNATTSKWVVEKLKLQAKERHKLMHMAVGMKRLNVEVKRALHRTTMIPTYRKAHFPRVSKLVMSIPNPYDDCLVIEETDMDSFKNLLMRVAKSEIWALRDAERLSEDATVLLTKALHSRPDNALMDVSFFFDDELKYPGWVGCMESCSQAMGDLFYEQIQEWRFSHDLSLFESLVAFNFILDSLDRIIPDIATSDDVLKFGTDYVSYQRKKIDLAIERMTSAHPTIMASVITEIAAQRVMDAAHHAAHGELDCGFSQRDTASILESVHAVIHQVHELPMDMEAVSIANVLPMTTLADGCISETMLRLQRECKTMKAQADEYIKLERKDILVIIVGSAASSRNLREISKSTVSIDTLVVGSDYGAACHVSDLIFNDDVIALTEVTYGILPGNTVEDLMKLDERFAHNIRMSGASFIAWGACRSLMRDNMMPNFSKVDAYHACRHGQLIEIGMTEGVQRMKQLTKLSQDVFYLRGEDVTGSIRSDNTSPFLIPRCASFEWKRGALVYAVDFSLAKGAFIAMSNEELYEAGGDSDAEGGDEEHHHRRHHHDMRIDSSHVLFNHTDAPTRNGNTESGGQEMTAIVTPNVAEGAAASAAVDGNRRPDTVKSAAPRAVGLAYDPATGCSRIPFVTHGQLLILASLERLQFLARNYCNVSSSETRQFLEAEVTHALGQLIQFCGALFPAEAAIYRIAIRMGEKDVASSPLGMLKAPKWFRGSGAAATAPAPEAAPSAAAAAAAAEGGAGGAALGTSSPSTPAKAHWHQVKKSVAAFHERRSSIFERAGHPDAPPPITVEQIRLLHNHMEEHEAFLGFVANFVSGHTSRLVSKRTQVPTLASVADAVITATKQQHQRQAPSSPGSPPNASSDAPNAVSLTQFLRTAKAFINQHCIDDRAASVIVESCLGPKTVQGLSSAQHAISFWHASCCS